MIVKVQQSLFSSDNKPTMLIYNKGKTFLSQDDLSDQVKRLLNGRPKAYFNAKIVGTELVIEDECVTEQDW